MVELEKRISGDWIDLRGKSNELHALMEALPLPPYGLKTVADKLKLSVEQGVVEFKRTVLGPVLVALEGARFKSLAGEEMMAHERSLTAMLLVILVQRLLAAELLPMARPPEEKRSFGIDAIQVGVILADVNARIKGNPALRANAAVKNILMQVQRYNGENQKMRELLPTIRTEMRTSFLANFTRTFDEIIGSIRKNYLVLLQEERAAEKSRHEGFSLATMPLKELSPLLMSQAREVARIRSTLAHARDEKYKTREVLVRLYDGRQSVLRLIEEEGKAFRRICQHTMQYDLDACSLAVANGFRDEIVGVLEKLGRKEEPARKAAPAS
jgi:hypothetical protein